MTYHHVIASHLNKVRQALKETEHYIDAHHDFDVERVRRDLLNITAGVYEVMNLIVPSQHEHLKSVDELFTEEEDRKAHE